MYFTQTLDGAIPEIWYQTDDSPYFVNVKVSAINAFQTRVVQPGSPLQAQEHDPVGYHYSTFVGSSIGSGINCALAHSRITTSQKMQSHLTKTSAHFQITTRDYHAISQHHIHRITLRTSK
jgi:hypothetical protein